MTKEKFVEFIKELGFTQTWGFDSNSFILKTDIVDVNSKFVDYYDELSIIISDEHQLVQLSLSQISTHITAGKKFGNFSLKTFGDSDDFQLEIFLSFIKGSFNIVPDNIIKYMRDKKIKNILQQ